MKPHAPATGGGGALHLEEVVMVAWWMVLLIAGGAYFLGILTICLMISAADSERGRL